MTLGRPIEEAVQLITSSLIGDTASESVSSPAKDTAPHETFIPTASDDQEPIPPPETWDFLDDPNMSLDGMEFSDVLPCDSPANSKEDLGFSEDLRES